MSNPERIKAIITKELPMKRGEKRVWIETQKIHDTDIAKQGYKYEYNLNYKTKKLTITPVENGKERKVTLRKKNNMPVIDVNNKEMTKLFKDTERVTIKIYVSKIVIEPLKEEMEQNRARRKLKTKKPTFIDLFSGGSTLAKSLQDSGMECVGAVEIEKDNVFGFELNLPNAMTYTSSIADVDWNLMQDATIISVAPPCTSYSIAGKKDGEDGDSGLFGIFTLNAVEIIRPGILILENTPLYRDSSVYKTIKFVLNLRGYKITDAILDATATGGMTKRKRLCMVATMADKPFEFDHSREFTFKSVRDILEVEIEDRVWLDEHNSKTMKYSLEVEKKHKAKGNGFKLGRVYLDSTLLPSVTAGYYKGRLTDAILVHPNDETKFSWFTPRELARINSLPDNFKLPSIKTRAGIIIGQGVDYSAFNKVGRDVLKHMKAA